MKEFNLPSQHGNLRGVVWDDVRNPIGTVQIAHGLAEYHGRYIETAEFLNNLCLLYTSPSPRDPTKSRMPSSA